MMKKVLSVLIIIAATIAIIANLFLTNTKVNMQIIKYDNQDNSEQVIETKKVKENDEINFSKYDGNTIKILKITNKNITISYEATKYKEIDKPNPENIEGTYEPYTETITEEISYNASRTINKNKTSPNGPLTAPRYYYSFKFTK